MLYINKTNIFTNCKTLAVMKKHQIKPIVLVLLFLTILFSCSKEDIILEQNLENSLFIETVSINEAKNLFEESNSSTSLFSKSSGKPYIVPNLNKITQEAINNTNELLTVIPVTTPEIHLNSRVLLLKIDSKIKSVVFNMTLSKNDEKNFTGKIFITELDGAFLYGYKIDKGKTVSKWIISKETKKKHYLKKLTSNS